MRTRVLSESGLVPICGPNPRYVNDGKGTEPDANGNFAWVRDCDSHAVMSAGGAESMALVYNGSLNSVPMWEGLTAAQISGGPNNAAGRNLDWSKQRQLCDPPDRAACLAIGKLAASPETYNATAKPHCPLCLDVEGAPSMAIQENDTPARRAEVLQNYLNAVRWLREGSGYPGQEVWIDGHFPGLYSYRNNDPICEAVLKQLAREVSAACGFLYFWDAEAENDDLWIRDLEAIDAAIAENAPWHAEGGKVLLVNPIRQIYWPEHDKPEARVLANQTRPMKLWTPFIDEVKRRGFWIVAWTGNAIVDAEREQLQYVLEQGFDA